jgi:hypothetical protein
LGKIRFIFPNSRSMKLFRKYIEEEFKQELKDPDLPRPWTRTFSEQAEEMAGTRRATDLELQVMLYKAYREVAGEAEAKSFDSFAFWIETLLSDFNEIDKYLVDTNELFKNVKDFKRIQANYLTPEQLEIIQSYWKLDPIWEASLTKSITTDSDDFWRHIHTEDGTKITQQRFRALWDMMPQIYAAFTAKLDSEGKAYPGLSYRKAALKAKDYAKRHAQTISRYVFVGFNSFTAAEYLICKELQKVGKVDFYWDYNDVLMHDTCKMLHNLTKEFPSTYKLEMPVTPEHKVEIYGVPSNSAQVSVMQRALQGLAPEESVAVVLPDETLLQPVLLGMPDNCTDINVTIGYPINRTAVAALFDLVVGMQLRSRENSSRQVEFFRDDVISVLSNAIVADAYPKAVTAVMTYLRDNALFNLPADAFTADQTDPEMALLKPIFTPLPHNATVATTTAYISGVMDFAQEALRTPLERKYAETMQRQLQRFSTLLTDIEMQPATFFQLLQRTLFRGRVPLTSDGGEDHDAQVQVLGLLETRVLDFQRVVMMSMTDRTMPGSKHGRSFVPDVLRRAYGLPTSEHREEESAYLFYRLLSAARNLTFIFDARTGGLRSGDMSRFLYQLRFLTPKGVDVKYFGSAFEMNPLGAPVLNAGTCGVKKTPEVMALLNRYRDPQKVNQFKFSASSLKTYLDCPLHFYLERVADLAIADEQEQIITEGIYGNIFHEVAEKFFGSLDGKTYDKQRLEDIRKKDSYEQKLLESLIVRSINHNYLNIPPTVKDEEGNNVENPNINKPLVDDAKLFKEPLRKIFNKMLKHEEPGFTYVEGEQVHTFHWSRFGINFTMKIDRVDEIDGLIRLIDYKTGSDETKYSNMEALFRDSGSKKAAKAIFQLYTYCVAYKDSPKNSHLDRDSIRLRPVVYALRDMGDKYFPLIKNGKKEITEFTPEIEQSFTDLFQVLIAEIFDENRNFTRTADPDHCTYCKFTELCSKRLS